jgi:hypothetical protein
MNRDEKFKVGLDNFVPSLRDVVEANKLDPMHLSVAARAEPDRDKLLIQDRHEVFVTDGRQVGPWQVPSLRDLGRGEELPPPDINRYPEEYSLLFWAVEKHIVDVGGFESVPTDAQFEEWYSNLRRRPDGRSLGPVHDYLWQVAALLLGMFPLSEAQFEGIFGALALSASRWRIGHSSRNYMDYLRQQTDLLE